MMDEEVVQMAQALRQALELQVVSDQRHSSKVPLAVRKLIAAP